jgi:hypothetical protein
MSGHASFTPVLRAYRIYGDGTESGSSALAAQDIAPDIDVSSGNQQAHIRVSIEETGGGSGVADDTWQLQYSKNGGTWTNVTASSSNVQADTGSGLTDDGATTNRASEPILDPVSTWQAGKQEEGNGVLAFGQNNDTYTEHVYAVLLIAADLADGDALTFRVSYEAGTPGFTHNVTPTIDVTKGLTIVPDGIASGNAFGQPTITYEVQPTGLANASAYGQPTVSDPYISPTGFANVSAFGSPSLAYEVQPTGVASANAAGQPSLAYVVAPMPLNNGYEVLAPDGELNGSTCGFMRAGSAPNPPYWNQLDEGYNSGDSSGFNSHQNTTNDEHLQLTLPTPSGEVDTNRSMFVFTRLAVAWLPGPINLTVSLYEDGTLLDDAAVLDVAVIGAVDVWHGFVHELDCSGVTDKTNLEIRLAVGGSGGQQIRFDVLDAHVPVIRVGSPTIVQVVAPDGIASTNAIGQPSLTQIVQPSSLVNAQAFGLADVANAGGTQVIEPTGIASAAAYGLPTIAHQAVPNVAPDSILRGERVFCDGDVNAGTTGWTTNDGDYYTAIDEGTQSYDGISTTITRPAGITGDAYIEMSLPAPAGPVDLTKTFRLQWWCRRDTGDTIDCVIKFYQNGVLKFTTSNRYALSGWTYLTWDFVPDTEGITDLGDSCTIRIEPTGTKWMEVSAFEYVNPDADGFGRHTVYLPDVQHAAISDPNNQTTDWTNTGGSGVEDALNHNDVAGHHGQNVVNDSVYITAFNAGSQPADLVVHLTDMPDPDDDSSHYVRFRYQIPAGVGNGEFTFQVWQGDPNNGGTLVKGATTGNAYENWRTGQFNLSTGEAANFTDYRDVWLLVSVPNANTNYNLSYCVLNRKATANQAILPDPVVNASAFGSPAVTQVVVPDGIASAAAIGTPTVVQIVQPTSLVNASAFGLPTVLADQLIEPTGIASAAAVGQPSVFLTQTIVPVSLVNNPSQVQQPNATNNSGTTDWLVEGGGTHHGAVDEPVDSSDDGTQYIHVSNLVINDAWVELALPDFSGGDLTGEWKIRARIKKAGAPAVNLEVKLRESGTLRTTKTLAATTSWSTVEATFVPNDDGWGAMSNITARLVMGGSALDLAVSALEVVSPSGVVFGLPDVILTQVVVPDGIASANAFGQPSLTQIVQPTSLVNASAIGLPDVFTPLNISPTGFANVSAFGLPVVNPLKIVPTGIASANAFGEPDVVGPLNPVGYENVQAFGLATVEQDGTPLTIEVIGIAPTAAFGQPDVSTGTTTIFPEGKLNGQAFGLPTVVQVVQPVAIARTSAVGVPSVRTDVVPVGIANTNAFGLPTVGNVVVPDGIATANAFGLPVVTPGTITIVPDGIASGAAAGLPTVLAGTVNATGIASVAAVGVPTVTQVVQVAGIASTDAVGQPSVGAPGTPTIVPVGISSVNAFGLARAANRVFVTGFANSSAVGLPDVVGSIHPEGFANAQAFGLADVVTVGPAIVPVGIANVNAFGEGHTITLNIHPSGLANSSAVGQPAVVLRPAIVPDGIVNASAFGLPAVSGAAIAPAGIASVSAVGLPTITPGTITVVPIGLGGGEAFGLPIAQLTGFSKSVNVDRIANLRPDCPRTGDLGGDVDRIAGTEYNKNR